MFAVDTQILIYALREAKGTDSDRQLTLSAQRLLSRQTVVIVPAIAWFEVLRGAKPEESAALERIQDRMDVRAVTGAVATRAAAILAQRSAAEKTCRRCLSSEKSKACTACGITVSVHQKYNDALIVATAEAAGDVDVLYTNDDGVLAMQQYANVSIERLPIDADGPLFDARTAKTQPGQVTSEVTSAPVS